MLNHAIKSTQVSPYERIHECGQKMLTVPVRSNPKASEFYCEKCRASERMPVEVADVLNSHKG